MLLPQDILVSLRLILASKDEKPTLQDLSVDLGISASQVHAAIRRAAQSQLLVEESRQVNRTHLKEFLIHGLKYLFPPVLTGATRGVPTSIAVPPLSEHFSVEADFTPVWPHPLGTVAGLGLEPIHRAVPEAAMRNPELHQWLALTDAVRAGRGRERALAVKELERRLS